MTISQGSHLNFTLHLTIQMSEHIVFRFMVLNFETVYPKTLQIQHPSQYFNKKAQHRSWHMAICNMLQHLKWNMNAWDTVISLHGRHFPRYLGICNPICIKLLQLMSGVTPHNSVKKRSLCINKWLNYSHLYCLTAVILFAILEFVIRFASNFHN